MIVANRIGWGVIGMALALGSTAAAAEVVVVVAQRSPVSALSRNQITDIFLGRTSQFPNGGQAVPIDQPEGSAARDEFYAWVAGKSPAQIKAHWSKIIFTGRGQPPREVSNSVNVKKELVQNPNAIGYIEREAVDPSVKVVPVQ